jgi:DNA replication protein DnaC
VNIGYDIRTDYLNNEDTSWLTENFPEIGDSPYSYCPTCKKTGTYFWDGKQVDCDCEMQLQLHKHYTVSGIGLTYQRLSWDDWEGSDEVRYAADIVVDGDGLILWGEPGTGKTMTGSLILKDLIKRGNRCYYLTMEAMIDEFTAGWKDDDRKRWFDRKIRLIPVLCLDDLGKERGRGQLPQSTFDNLLRARVQAGRPTIITTNIHPDDLGLGYGASVLNSLLEQGTALQMVGDNWHRKVAIRRHQERAQGWKRPIQ